MPSDLLLDIELSQFEVFKQLVQLAHLHFFLSQKTLQFLSAVYSLTLRHFFTKFFDVYLAIHADTFHVRQAEKFLNDRQSQLVVLLGVWGFCMEREVLMRNQSIFALKFFSPFLFYYRIVSITLFRLLQEFQKQNKVKQFSKVPKNDVLTLSSFVDHLQQFFSGASALRVSIDTAADQFFDKFIQMFWNLGQILGLSDVQHDLIVVQLLFSPGNVACCQLKQSTAQTPNISLSRIDSLNDRLRSHPIRSPFLSLASLGLVIHHRQSLVEAFRTSEISQFEDSFACQKHVGAFEIFVDYFMLVEVVQSGDQLSGEVQVCFQRWWSEIFIEIFECPRDVLHEDAGLLLQVVVFKIPHYVFVVNFGENCDLGFALLFVLLTEVYLLHCRQDTIVDVESLIDAAGSAAADHLADFPFLDASVLAHQVVLDYPLLSFFEQQGNALHYRHPLLPVRAIFQNLCLYFVV